MGKAGDVQASRRCRAKPSVVMMMTSVWASFKSTMRGVQRNRVLQERAQTIRGALSRISSELSMSYLSFNRPLDEQRHFTLFEGRDEFERDNVTFSTFAHLRLRQDANESDQAVIQYFVAGDPEDRSRQHLYRRESRRLMGDLPADMEDYLPAYIAREDAARTPRPCHRAQVECRPLPLVGARGRHGRRNHHGHYAHCAHHTTLYRHGEMLSKCCTTPTEHRSRQKIARTTASSIKLKPLFDRASFSVSPDLTCCGTHHFLS